MNQGLKPAATHKEKLALPLLIECDTNGRILSMGPDARAILGQPASLSDLVIVPVVSRQHGSSRFRICSWHFWRVLEIQNSLVLGLRAPLLPDRAHLDVLRLQSRLLNNFLRLIQGERVLSMRVRRHPKPRNRTVELIELERQRLGRELHTGVGQTLAAIRLHLETIGMEIAEPPPKAAQALQHIDLLSAAALDQVRSVSRKLHPPDWQRFTVEEALQQLWRTSGIPDRFAGGLKLGVLPRQPGPTIKALLYRSLQETLSNVVRHAQASRIDAELHPVADGVTLTISDNGVGFDAAKLDAPPASAVSGIGLRSIREMVASAGGNFSVKSSPIGTTLVISVGFSPD